MGAILRETLSRFISIGLVSNALICGLSGAGVGAVGAANVAIAAGGAIEGSGRAGRGAVKRLVVAGASGAVAEDGIAGAGGGTAFAASEYWIARRWLPALYEWLGTGIGRGIRGDNVASAVGNRPTSGGRLDDDIALLSAACLLGKKGWVRGDESNPSDSQGCRGDKFEIISHDVVLAVVSDRL